MYLLAISPVPTRGHLRNVDVPHPAGGQVFRSDQLNRLWEGQDGDDAEGQVDARGDAMREDADTVANARVRQAI